MAHGAVRSLGLGALALVLSSCSDTGSPQVAASGASAGGTAGASAALAGTSSGGAGQNSAGIAGQSSAGSGGSVSTSGSSAGGMAGMAGSGGMVGPNVDVSEPKLHEFELDPHVLDATTADSPALQYAELDTRATPLGKLVVFLPGANNVPKDWREHGRQLAAFGFHVLIPHYNNRWSSDGTCDGQGNTCGDDTRWEALVGEDTSAAIAIARGDSAEGRVVTLIKHLVTAHPGGDWGYYLAADDALLYDKMLIAGISHGAASAGMYAARRPFTRNVMHSSGPAGSKAVDKMTPLSQWYAFAHTADPAYDAITGSWANFALIGELTNIDDTTPPYADSHRLVSSADSTYPHGSTCAHSSSPKDAGGKFLFEPAWRYLYGVP